MIHPVELLPGAGLAERGAEGAEHCIGLPPGRIGRQFVEIQQRIEQAVTDDQRPPRWGDDAADLGVGQGLLDQVTADQTGPAENQQGL